MFWVLWFANNKWQNGGQDSFMLFKISVTILKLKFLKLLEIEQKHSCTKINFIYVNHFKRKMNVVYWRCRRRDQFGGLISTTIDIRGSLKLLRQVEILSLMVVLLIWKNSKKKEFPPKWRRTRKLDGTSMGQKVKMLPIPCYQQL